MEGEDSEKHNREEEEFPLSEEVVDNKSISPIATQKGVSVQSVTLTSSFVKPPSLSSETRSNVTAGNLSPSERNTNSSKVSARKFMATVLNESEEVLKAEPKTQAGGEKSAGVSGVETFPAGFLSKRSPFNHNPPQPEERRARIQHPRTARDYIINLREDLADFQESHGLPRTRDYSFVSLGLALAQETARAVYSVFLMFAELFPILVIISLILRFALDKLIEILETPEPIPKLKKSIVFGLEMLVIVIPLWIIIGTIVLPLVSLLFSIFRRVFRFKGGKKKSHGSQKSRLKPKAEICSLFS